MCERAVETGIIHVVTMVIIIITVTTVTTVTMVTTVIMVTTVTTVTMITECEAYLIRRDGKKDLSLWLGCIEKAMSFTVSSISLS